VGETVMELFAAALSGFVVGLATHWYLTRKK